MNRMEQLIGFVETERKDNPGATHIADWALGEIERLQGELAAVTAERGRLLDLLAPAVSDAEWWDKRIHPARGEVFQNWRLSVYLPVRESESDKSVEAALARVLKGKS